MENLQELGPILDIASLVQNSVSNGKFAFIAVIVLMLMIEFYKSYAKKKSPEKFDKVKKNASKYAAGSGAAIGAAGSALSGDDPASGAIGGLLVGNASSGLYSSVIKPLINKVKTGEAGLLIGGGISLSLLIYSALKDTPKEKKQEILTEFDKALRQSKENNNTKALEKWLSKNL